MMASTAARLRTTSAPIPFGAPILCPEMVSIVAGIAPTDTGTWPKACTASVWNIAPAAWQRRPISSTGCRVPTSLLTHITDTTAGPAARAASSASSRTTPLPSTGRTSSSPPSRATAWAAASTALCSVAHTAARIRRPAARAASAPPITARLSASVPPEVNTTWLGSAPTAAATLRRASSRPARAARPNRWALDGLPKAPAPR